MKEFSIPPFYVGQEVVANCDHHQGTFKKGDEFMVKEIRKGCCGYEVTIGIRSVAGISRCHLCGFVEPSTGYWIFSASRFSPKIELSQFISMKQLAEQQLETIGAN